MELLKHNIQTLQNYLNRRNIVLSDVVSNQQVRKIAQGMRRSSRFIKYLLTQMGYAVIKTRLGKKQYLRNRQRHTVTIGTVSYETIAKSFTISLSVPFAFRVEGNSIVINVLSATNQQSDESIQVDNKLLISNDLQDKQKGEIMNLKEKEKEKERSKEKEKEKENIYNIYNIKQAKIFDENFENNENVTNESSDSSTTVKRKKPDQLKQEYAEGVYLTEAEYNKLLEKYDQEVVDLAIQKVSHYKMYKGRQYKSDYHAILQWGIESALETIYRRNKINTSPPPANNYNNRYSNYSRYPNYSNNNYANNNYNSPPQPNNYKPKQNVQRPRVLDNTDFYNQKRDPQEIKEMLEITKEWKELRRKMLEEEEAQQPKNNIRPFLRNVAQKLGRNIDG